MKKTIIFDVDGVILDSGHLKDQLINKVLDRHGLLDLAGAEQILAQGINRIAMIDQFYEIKQFDKQKVLEEINNTLRSLEENPVYIKDTVDFIKNHHDTYDFFTNTSMPKRALVHILKKHDLSQYFKELLAYEDGSKRKNIEYIIKSYQIQTKDTIFIDDKQEHLSTVQDIGIHNLLFVQDGISLEEKISNIFQ